MKVPRVGHALPQQLLHLGHPRVHVAGEPTRPLLALLLTGPDLFVGIGLGDAPLFAVVDLEIELLVKFAKEEVELLHLALVILTQFLLSKLAFGVVEWLFDRFFLESF